MGEAAYRGFVGASSLLTMIADEMAPEAFDRSAIYAGLATVAGFALAAWLTSVG
jgi:ZIP family zinc transporter